MYRGHPKTPAPTDAQPQPSGSFEATGQPTPKCCRSPPRHTNAAGGLLTLMATDSPGRRSGASPASRAELLQCQSFSVPLPQELGARHRDQRVPRRSHGPTFGWCGERLQRNRTRQHLRHLRKEDFASASLRLPQACNPKAQLHVRHPLNATPFSSKCWNTAPGV